MHARSSSRAGVMGGRDMFLCAREGTADTTRSSLRGRKTRGAHGFLLLNQIGKPRRYCASDRFRHRRHIHAGVGSRRRFKLLGGPGNDAHGRVGSRLDASARLGWYPR